MLDGEVIRGLSVSNPTAPWSNRIFSHLFVSLFPLKSETKKTNYIRRSRPRPGSFPKNQTSRLNISWGVYRCLSTFRCLFPFFCSSSFSLFFSMTCRRFCPRWSSRQAVATSVVHSLFRHLLAFMFAEYGVHRSYCLSVCIECC